MRIFYTASDIEDLAASGVKQWDMGPGVTLTGAAKERAEERKIALVTPGSKAAAASTKAAAAALSQGGTAQSGAAQAAALPARPKGCQHGPLAAKSSPSNVRAATTTAASGGPMVEQLVEAVSALKKSVR